MTGFVCRVCNRFIPSEEDTQVHCRTLTHYNNYCNVVRAKVSINFTSEEKLIYVQSSIQSPILSVTRLIHFGLVLD